MTYTGAMVLPQNAVVMQEEEMMDVEGGNPVVIFCAGIAVGYIVDGVVKTYSGKTCADWVAYVLKKWKKNKKAKSITTPSKYYKKLVIK